MSFNTMYEVFHLNAEFTESKQKQKVVWCPGNVHTLSARLLRVLFLSSCFQSQPKERADTREHFLC